MAKRKTKCVFCGQHDKRQWRFCSRCGCSRKTLQFQHVIRDGWKQVAAIGIVALLIVAIIGGYSPK